MQIRFCGVLRNAKQLCHFGKPCAEPKVEPQGRLADLGKRLDALSRCSIALRCFKLPVGSRILGHRTIREPSRPHVGFGSELALSGSLRG